MGSDQFGATIMASASADSSDGIQRVILRLSNIEVFHELSLILLFVPFIH